MTTLEDLYYGNISPHEKYMHELNTIPEMNDWFHLDKTVFLL